MNWPICISFVYFCYHNIFVYCVEAEYHRRILYFRSCTVSSPVWLCVKKCEWLLLCQLICTYYDIPERPGRHVVTFISLTKRRLTEKWNVCPLLLMRFSFVVSVCCAMSGCTLKYL